MPVDAEVKTLAFALSGNYRRLKKKVGDPIRDVERQFLKQS